MVRCYEFYVMVKNNPTKCEKSDSMQSRINEYMDFMDKKGIKFDKSETDKASFVRMQEIHGSERDVTQPSLKSQDTVAHVQEERTAIPQVIIESPPIQPSVEKQIVESCPVSVIRPLLECAGCHMASRETTEHKGETLCPRCLVDAQYHPDKKPVAPAPVSMSVLKPKDTWEQRKAQMQVPVSKMETTVLSKLEQKDMHPEVQREFCLRITRPDYYFAEQNIAIYLDGEVHKGREDRDEAIRELLTKRYGVRVVTIAYEGSSEATEDSIVQQITEALQLI